MGCTTKGRAGALSERGARARSARQTLQFQTVAHQPTTTDCQPTLNNGIQVFVTGKLAVQLALSPAPPPPKVTRPHPDPALPRATRYPPRRFYLWPILLRPASTAPHEACLPDPRHSGRGAAALSCLRLLRRTGRQQSQPVDVFAGTRPTPHPQSSADSARAHSRAGPAVRCALISVASRRARSRSCSTRPPRAAGTSTTISSA